LVYYGADVNAKDEQGRTPLFLACGKNNLNIMKFLINRGADINVEIMGKTLLFWACAYGNFNIVKLLIARGVNIKDEEKSTLLHNACESGYSDIVTLLIDNGIDVNIKNDRGNTLYTGFVTLVI
jgi:ankyrin repeat protein